MKGWIVTLLLVPSTALFFAAGCGSVDVTSRPDLTGMGGSSGASGHSGGSGANLGSGGTVIVGEGGANTSGCPSTCEELDASCGYVTDTKCGGVIQCGDCPDGQACGASAPSQCGDGTAGSSSGGSSGAGDCTPSSCDDLKANCGHVTDPKCSGKTVDCGTCPKGQTCGFGGPNQCGDDDGGGDCVVDPATTCAGRGATCGHVADNCGNDLDCGPTTCPVKGQSCIQNVCNTPTCIVDPKTTCAGRGFTCGQAADNCGHLLDCGGNNCDIPGWSCGGGTDDSGDPIVGVCGCTGECSKVPSCPAGTTTTLKGKVYDPAGANPLYRVLVYVANDPSDPALKSFPKGLTCDVCGASAAGSPLVSDPTVTDPPAGTYTGVDGSFELENVPVDKGVTLVIQLGRWRRLFKVDIDKACDENTVQDGLLRMPATQAEGDIPLMAMVTGDADSLECVLRKMGIASSEFTNPGGDAADVGKGAGRVQFYLGEDKDDSGQPGQQIDANTPHQAKLFQTGASGDPVLNEYDMTILACQGAAETESASDQSALRDYAAAGGRVFATHFSYTWLYQNDASAGATAGTADNWSEVAKWHPDGNDDPDTAVGIIDKVSNPKGDAFQGWLEAVNASTPGSGQVDVVVIRHDTDTISSVAGQTQQWLYRVGTNTKFCAVTGGTCNSDSDCTPKVCSVNHAKSCSSDSDCTAKVCNTDPTKSCTRDRDCTGNNARCSSNTCKANGCSGFDYTGQHVPLHFTYNTPVNLTQDLTATPPVVQCGRVLFSDFHVQDANEGGKTFPAQCGKACSADSDCTGSCSGGHCPWGAACSKSSDCASKCSDDGRCLDPMNPQEKLLEYMIFDLGSCVPPPKSCVPLTECPDGQDCGYAPDGCNGLIPCGTCPDGELCGVGDPPVPNHCGTISCTPDTECPGGQECGFASDGCNGVVDCGECPSGQTCQNGQCGSGSCEPKSCAQQGIECGQAGDECGNQIQCPACPANQTCIMGKCVPQACQPQSCSDQHVECGSAADGCGNKIDSCGTCGAGSLCVNGQCIQIK